MRYFERKLITFFHLAFLSLHIWSGEPPSTSWSCLTNTRKNPLKYILNSPMHCSNENIVLLALHQIWSDFYVLDIFSEKSQDSRKGRSLLFKCIQFVKKVFKLYWIWVFVSPFSIICFFKSIQLWIWLRVSDTPT